MTLSRTHNVIMNNHLSDMQAEMDKLSATELVAEIKLSMPQNIGDEEQATRVRRLETNLALIGVTSVTWVSP